MKFMVGFRKSFYTHYCKICKDYFESPFRRCRSKKCSKHSSAKVLKRMNTRVVRRQQKFYNKQKYNLL